MACCTSLVYKIVIFVFNAVIAGGAAALIAFGIRYTEAENNGINIFGDFLFGVVAVVAGGAALLVIILGCIGAWFERSKLLLIYGGVLMALFVVQLSLGIMAITKIQNSVDFADDVNKITGYLFEDDPAQFDKLQKEFQCCGVSGSADYIGTYPASCCENSVRPCTTPFGQGCAAAFMVVIKDYIRTIGYLAVVFAVINLVGALFAFLPRKKPVSQKEDAWY